MPAFPRPRPNTTPATKGFTLTFAIDEGPRYRFGDISVICNVPGLECDKLRLFRSLVNGGAVFDGNALDKSSEVLAIEMAKLGYPFARALPRTLGNADSGRMDVAFVIDQGPRTYVERIEIHGNTRTRDYVIRREFDIAEGDRLQQDADRSGRAAPEELELLQDGEDIEQAGLDAGSCRARRRGDRPVDRRFQRRRRLFDHRWRARRGQGGRAQFLRHRERTCRPPSPTANMRAESIWRRPSPIFSAPRSRPGSSCSAGKPTPTATNPTAAPPMVRRCNWARRSTSNSACSGATRSTTRTSRWRRTARA